MLTALAASSRTCWPTATRRCAACSPPAACDFGTGLCQDSMGVASFQCIPQWTAIRRPALYTFLWVTLCYAACCRVAVAKTRRTRRQRRNRCGRQASLLRAPRAAWHCPSPSWRPSLANAVCAEQSITRSLMERPPPSASPERRFSLARERRIGNQGLACVQSILMLMHGNEHCSDRNIMQPKPVTSTGMMMPSAPKCGVTIWV